MTNRILELLQGPDPDDAAFVAWWDATFTGAPCHGDMTAHAVAYAAWLGRGGDVARRLRDRAKELSDLPGTVEDGLVAVAGMIESGSL